MPPCKPTLVVIEDELPIRRFLRATLAGHGYHLLEATTGMEGLDLVARQQPDLILLDLGLPDIDGLDVTRRVREWSQIPIVILSARGQEPDKIAALDAGADDYVTKPFAVGELIARIGVALRHAAQATAPTEASTFTVGELCVDLLRRQVFVAGTEVHLTPIEYSLLTTLVHYAGRVVTHTQLLKAVWGPAYTDATPYLRVYMGQLRRKLEANPSRPRYLTTELGVGYRLRSE